MLARILLLFLGCQYVLACTDKYWCAERIAKDPTSCYHERTYNECCTSCRKYSSGAKGCEWGDQASWCTKPTAHVDCYNARTKELCCDKCAGVKITTPGPSTTRGPLPTFQPGSSAGSGECGRTPIRPNLMGYIVGGVEARPHSIPWQVGVGEQGYGQNCGGSIINKNTVITAAHCIKSDTEYSVVVGQHKKYGYNDKYYKQIDAARVIVHPQYKTLSKYDIAIVKTKTDIQFNDAVQPICLPSPDQTYSEDKSMFLVSGWGALKEGWASHLMQLAVPYISQAHCESKLGRQNIHEAVICAGYLEGGKDTCQGDSGGPLATRLNGKWTLAGVVSWGIGCAQKNYPGVYTNVAKYIDFINQYA